MTPTPALPSVPNPQNIVEKAKEDLAKRLSLSVSQIQLVEARNVTWPDSSLGCPRPGMAYAQILTPGFLIRLEANETNYEYHAGKEASPFLCENPMPPVPGTPDDI